MPITSSKNTLLREIRRAAASGRPMPGELVVAEGPHLAEEAVRGHWAVRQVLVAESFQSRYKDLIGKLGAEVVEVADRAFESAAATEHPQGIITLLRPRPWSWNDLCGKRALVVVLDGVQDPGNAGTIVRSAEAFGATGVVLLSGSVRVANGKFLRAAAGSAFRVPLIENLSDADFLANIRRDDISLYALAADGAADISELDWTRPAAFVLGSEGAGVSTQIRSSATAVRIPVFAIESLNVGIAGSIALFDAARQRRNIG